MNNDLLQQALNAARIGRDPMPILQEAAKTNPQVAQVLQMARGGSLQEAAQVIAKRNGINLDGFVQSFLSRVGFPQ